MLIGSVIQIHPFDFKPSAPDTGTFLVYAKTDNILYIQDDTGTEYPFATTSALTALTGDVSATGPGSVAATVNSVGGKTAAQIASAVTQVQAATSSNTPLTIVVRDASGNFSAGTITASLTGAASLNVLKSGDTMTGPLVITDNSVAALKVDGDVLVVDGTNNRVGINELNPTEALDVTGNIIATGTITGSNLSGTNTGNVTVTDTTTIDLTISGQALTADVRISDSTITTDAGGIKVGTVTNANIGTGISATKISAGNVSNTEFDYLDGVTSPIQTQINNITGSAITALTGDVTATGPGSVAATVATVGGETAADIATSVNDTQAATDANTPSTIVKRDASGNFSAGTITANLTGNVNGVNPASHASRHLPTGADPLTTASAVTLDANSTNTTGTANSLARSDHTHDLSTGVVSGLVPDQTNAEGSSANLARADHIHNIPSGSVVQIGTSNFNGAAASFSLSDHVHSHGNQTNENLHALVAAGVTHGFMSKTDKTKLDASTNANTANAIVQRDASGDFSAGIITASLNGNATTSTSFTGALVGDVTGTQGATVVSTVGGKTASQISTSVNDTLAATDANTPSTLVKRDSNGNFSAQDVTVKRIIPTVVALTDAATIATDASLGTIFTVTLGGNRTLGAPTNPINGQKATWIIKQDATGNRTLAFNAVFNFPPAFAGLTLSTTANSYDRLGAEYNSVNSKWDIVAFVPGYT